MSAYNDQPQKANHYPPTHCNYNSICNCEPEVVVVEVQKPSGRNIIVPYGKVCVKSSSGNITNELNGDYTLIRWHSFCSECFILHLDKEKAAV